MFSDAGSTPAASTIYVISFQIVTTSNRLTLVESWYNSKRFPI